MKRDSIHTLVLCALLSAFALALSYIETLFPLPLPVPGARLGLGNALVLLALLTLGPAEAAGVLLTKTALSALLFGTPVSFLYAAAGGALSFGAMLLLNKRRSVTPIGQSIAGAVLHNLGQVLVAMLLTNTPRLLLYFTPLGLLGVLTGALSGLAAKLCAAKISPFSVWLTDFQRRLVAFVDRNMLRFSRTQKEENAHDLWRKPDPSAPSAGSFAGTAGDAHRRFAPNGFQMGT